MNLIEYLLGVQDEKVFEKIESTIQKSIKETKPSDISRAEFANKQIKKGHVITQKELEKQSKNW